MISSFIGCVMANANDFLDVQMKSMISNEPNPKTLGYAEEIYSFHTLELSKLVFKEYKGDGICVSGGLYKDNEDKTGVIPATSASDARYYAVGRPQSLVRMHSKNYNFLIHPAKQGNAEDLMGFIDLSISGYQLAFNVFVKDNVKADDYITMDASDNEYTFKKVLNDEKKLAVVVTGANANGVASVNFNVK